MARQWRVTGARGVILACLIACLALTGAVEAAGADPLAAPDDGLDLGIPSPTPSTWSTSPDPPAADEPDTLPPVTTAAGVAGSWLNAPVAVAFSASDTGGSGVAYTEYKLDATDWVQGTEVVVPAPADHSNDGPHTLLYRSADMAGNVEDARTLTVSIDTRRPETKAPYATTVMRFRVARLRYRITDALPNGGTADVTIRIRTRAGTVVKTLTYEDRPVNTLLSASFTCRLAKGDYRFSVYATDTAGNRQATAAGNRLRVTAPWSTTLPFRFRVTGVSLRDIPPSRYPLLNMAHAIPKVDTQPHDSQGVRMFWYGGRLYNHVVAQAAYGLQNLAAYNLTKDPFYLGRAEAQAQRLISRRDLSGTAWFHPYDFPWPGMRPPWYSAMGQGLGMALFGGLYEATGHTVYLRAAQGTFASYLRRGPSSLPWVVSVDAAGYLWLQEYPNGAADAVLNGHIYSAFGLYDYYQLTHDRRALELFNGAATTVLHYAGPRFRQASWRSYYRFSRDTVATPVYHQIHLGQFLTLYRLTGITAFARLSDAFKLDYPQPDVRRTIRVVPGVYTGLRFDSWGGIVGRRTWRTATVQLLPATRRERIHYRSGYWFTTTSGPWAGYQLCERAGRVYIPGVAVQTVYDPPRRLVLPAGHVYVGRRFDADGRVIATVRFSAPAASSAPVDRRAFVNGADQVRVADGPLSGYWLHLGIALLR